MSRKTAVAIDGGANGLTGNGASLECMTQHSTLLRSLAVTTGIIAAGAVSALAIHTGMSNGGGSVSVTAKGATITHAPALATMRLGKTVVDQAPALVTTTTTTRGR